MYKEGNILYFTPFYFKNGNIAKPKYFVVLKLVDGKTILASLPTRRDSVPTINAIKSGCVEIPEINLNCFVFAPDEPVTLCNKCFDFTTYIYGCQLDSYEIEILRDLYRIEGVDYEIFGEMKPELFMHLIRCLKKSKAVKKKFIRILEK
jgi:hypothetical protein